jgi:hypothetical protein
METCFRQFQCRLAVNFVTLNTLSHVISNGINALSYDFIECTRYRIWKYVSDRGLESNVSLRPIP